MVEISAKTAVITGGASGLGKAVAHHLHKLGANAALFDLDEKNGTQQAAVLGADRALFSRVNVCNEEDVRQALKQTAEKFGQIDLVINCAGIAAAEKVLSRKGVMPLDHFTKVVTVNLTGTFNVIRLAAELMVGNEPSDDGERGVIVNTASVAAYEGQVGQAAYSASKGGIVGLTLPLAREFAAHGIRVLAIAPGIFLTPMLEGLPTEAQESLGKSIPFPSRLGKPAEYASLVQQIIENPMLNGTTIRLDGAIRLAPR